MRTYMSCFSTKLQVSYKRRFSKAVRNHSVKYLSRILEITGISKFAYKFFRIRSRAFAYKVRTRTQTATQFFKPCHSYHGA